MQKIKLKPLSINEAWKGKRYKTNKYKSFERSLLYQLPQIVVPSGKLQLNLVFGFSNAGSDIDNPIKMVQDILQKKIKLVDPSFNDNRIYRLIVDKVIVKKGEEFIKFELTQYLDTIYCICFINNNPKNYIKFTKQELLKRIND